MKQQTKTIPDRIKVLESLRGLAYLANVGLNLSNIGMEYDLAGTEDEFIANLASKLGLDTIDKKPTVVTGSGFFQPNILCSGSVSVTYPFDKVIRSGS